jgi:DeoR/GlpR family transcriptional regulator of sugar metabolism
MRENLLTLGLKGILMPVYDRREKIDTLVNKRGYATVSELAEQFQVSEMTIRRDLDRLDEQKRIQRTFGGAAALGTNQPDSRSDEELSFSTKPEGKLVDRVDVLVASSVNTKYDDLLVERFSKKHIPVLAESLELPRTATFVAIDNQRAGLELGRWAGCYALEQCDGKAVILDLTYQLSNTQMRSRSFILGVKEIIPEAKECLSLNAQSRFETAYQLTHDALTVHKDINLIFAINDITALGAVHACRDLQIDPNEIIVLPFGLEGDTFKDALFKGGYCRAGLAMFPEIVGPVCVEAAILAFNRKPLPAQIVTPYKLLTRESLTQWYTREETGWKLRMDTVWDQLELPLDIVTSEPALERKLPENIGFIVPFMEHEWYQNLAKTMSSYARQLGIQVEIVDVDKDLANELDVRRREIAHQAAAVVETGDVLILDEGQLAVYLSEELTNHDGITVITNSIQVFNILKHNPEIILILTGGAYRRSGQVLEGPTAEGALAELRADKLFLTVAGISFNFGLSHTNISDVTIKKAMIHSAREVILLADHTFFEQEATIQVAPLSFVHHLITDDALPASTRLELSEAGIQVSLAGI